ncbi:hypothetical protein [Thalassotalea sp. G2M2-11]|uniref:hypothetical protein n=1 Tax=Thalassotalea sp. G2M2-11 TaxID=2787627 RepID=UPI0019D2179A|nr:hypothetical protein [Thalassotalea sp. G2M2-11]
MSAELFFIYDSHCPWSYATTQLVNAIVKAHPNMSVHLMHCGYFEGDSKVVDRTVSAVKATSDVPFDAQYLKTLSTEKDSTLAANILNWVQHKSPKDALTLLNNIQHAHFQQGNPIQTKDDVNDIINALKLSPPAKALQSEKFTKDSEITLHDIAEIQEIIGTRAIPALLLAHGENLTLLNHNLYLASPEKIVEAVDLELQK